MKAEHWHGTVNGYGNKGCRCGACTKAWAVYHGAYVKRHRPRISTWVRARRKARRDILVTLLGGRCVDCGAVDSEQNHLVFGHIDPATKRFDIAGGLDHSEADLIAEAQKTQLRCRSCHSKLTADRRRLARASSNFAKIARLEEATA